jgi:hypothetical protein
MTHLPRLNLTAVETGPWEWTAALVVGAGDHIQWSCRHRHAEPASALACARQARLHMRRPAILGSVVVAATRARRRSIFGRVTG